jgi:hypothetical protein
MMSSVAGSSKALIMWKQKNGGVYKWGMKNPSEPQLLRNTHPVLCHEATFLPIDDIKHCVEPRIPLLLDRLSNVLVVQQ